MEAPVSFTEHELRSATLSNTRRIWIQAPAVSGPAGLLVLLDGEYYLTHVRTPKTVRDLQVSAGLPPLLTVYVSHVDGPTRHRENVCLPGFASFVTEELPAWLDERFEIIDGPGARGLGGLSLTGLSALHAAVTGAPAFGRVLAQSASVWWSEGRFIDELRRLPSRELSFRVSIGREETEENVAHSETLFQKESQLSANRRLRDVLLARGASVSYEEVEGGHKAETWARELPRALEALFS